MDHVAELQRQLHAMADQIEQVWGVPDEWVRQPFVVGNTRYTLHVRMTPAGLRERADKLTLDAKRLKTNPYGNANAISEAAKSSRREVESARAGKLPTIRRTYSADLAQHFLDNDELDNWQAYQQKYGRPCELNAYRQDEQL